MRPDKLINIRLHWRHCWPRKRRGQETIITNAQGTLETQEEQDRWLSENREAINAKIRRGIEQLVSGQGIAEDHLDAHMADLKAKPE